MTVNEIFTTLASHMENGIKMHDDFVKAFNFLGLKGYKKCHHYHFLEETQNYYYLCHYYMDHYHQMLENQQSTDVKVIPQSWYKYTQFEVDTGTKRNAIRDIMKQWVDWERSTKELLQTLYKELDELNEFAAAKKIEYFLCDVDEELKGAEKEWLMLETIGYDIISITERQDSLYNKYKKKIKKIYK